MSYVTVSTPSRLHFGLLRVHESNGHSFGGLGMMIDRPRVELQLGTATQWRTNGPGAERAAEFAGRALESLDLADKLPALDIEIRSIVPQHRGLGGGTQLALAIAAGVRKLADLPPASAAELAAAVDRGARSAVGSHGFVHGGLIWERGRTTASQLSELTSRVEIPAQWRVVLVATSRERGLSGEAEQRAFDALPKVPSAVTDRLQQLAEVQILPAARSADLDSFGEAVHEYGLTAGECFAAVQGGPYASAEIAACVAAIRSMGICGVGQSSWGPTVFAITESDESAATLALRLRGTAPWSEYAIDVCGPDNMGAVVESVTTAPQSGDDQKN